MRIILICVVLFTASTNLFAAPFSACTPDAYLTQGTIATTYSVNLSTGEYALKANSMGIRGKINATGFNPNDNYLYGWSHRQRTVVRIGNDFQAEPLAVENVPFPRYFVGDVSTTRNEYYVYRRGAAHGLYAIPLDVDRQNYLTMRRIVDGATLDLNIFDMAFHPTNGLAYGVDKKGLLHEINVDTGLSQTLDNTGQKGTFGAAYFDADGNLYISRNRDGHIFRIDIENANYTAEFFSAGPSSSINDGARCALAPIEDSSITTIDFGDAPASYGTLLADNGARHGIPVAPGGDTENSAGLMLGETIDGESDAAPFPMSDDTIDNNNDDDGVQFATGLVVGNRAVLLVTANATGYLQGWIDFDQDGTFDFEDQVISDQLVGAGSNVLFIDVPPDARPGSSWARFRLASTDGVQATGGAANGEVEDYQITVTGRGSSVTYYPSAGDWTTVAFEDNWPIEGDYDMNDLVVYMRTATYKQMGLINFIQISGEIAAVGAAYHNGFAIRLPGIRRDQIAEDDIIFTINDSKVTSHAPLEAFRDEAILILMHNVWDYVSAGEDCTFYRTETGCGSQIQARFEISVPLREPATSSSSGVYDPFIFATTNAWHGSHYSEPPGRRYEIHLKNQQPTEVFDLSLRDVEGSTDATDPASNRYFQSANGLPWALEIGSRWQYPLEYHDLLEAYPEFERFVISNGRQAPAWYASPQTDTTVLFVD